MIKIYTYENAQSIFDKPSWWIVKEKNGNGYIYDSEQNASSIFYTSAVGKIQNKAVYLGHDQAMNAELLTTLPDFYMTTHKDGTLLLCRHRPERYRNYFSDYFVQNNKIYEGAYYGKSFYTMPGERFPLPQFIIRTNDGTVYGDTSHSNSPANYSVANTVSKSNVYSSSYYSPVSQKKKRVPINWSLTLLAASILVVGNLLLSYIFKRQLLDVLKVDIDTRDTADYLFTRFSALAYNKIGIAGYLMCSLIIGFSVLDAYCARKKNYYWTLVPFAASLLGYPAFYLLVYIIDFLFYCSLVAFAIVFLYLFFSGC